MTKNELFETVSSFQILENVSMGEQVEEIHNESMESRFILLPKEHRKTYFSDFCEKYQEETGYI
jgi:hypothetical protein